MRFFVLAVVLSVAYAAKLDNTYLPPSHASTSGGASFLSAPSSSIQSSAPAPVIPILKYSNENLGDGGYQYSYETGDGISAQEQGELRNAGTDSESIAARGSYSYTGPDGVLYTVTYIADENGFRAEGAHLPTPPPIPEAIARSLEVIAAAEAAKARQTVGSVAAATSQQGYNYQAPAQQQGYNYQQPRPSNQYLPARQ